MKELTRTLVYVGAAVLFVLGAVGVSYLTAPTSPEAYSQTGEPFFEDFELDSVARLELSAIPEGETQPQTFQLAKRDNVWRLETYRGYPAEAKDRLGKTVASVLGLVREAVVGRSKSEHARFGVLNPDDEELEDHESAGKRIRMLDGDGNALVDLIIGKPVSESDDAGSADAASSDQNEEHLDKPKPKHYVRRADEEETYIATIELDISTKFSEWIEPDLLKLNPENVRTLKLDNYEKKEETFMTANGPISQVTPVNREKVTLTRNDQVASWSIPNLDEKTKSVRTAKIDELLRVLDEMTILGVAPRYEVDGRSPLTGDLQFQAPPSANDERARFNVLRRMALDLSKHGFSLQLDQATVEKILRGQGPVPLKMLSQNGDITVATHEGVVYHLHFGKQVVGTEKEIQIGGQPKQEEPAKKSSKKKGAKEKSPDKKPAGKKQDADETTRRYVLIRVEYDEAFYKDKPKKPEKPVPPRRPVIPAPKPRHVVGPVEAPRPSPRRKGRAPAVASRPDPVAHFYAMREDYRDKQRQYENDQRTYESDLKSFRANVKKVKERVERLNGRFDGWYYVISTQNLKQLTLRRGDLVGPKTESKKPGGHPKLPFKLPKR